MKKLLTFFFPLNRLSGKMKKVGDFTFFFIPLLSFYASKNPGNDTFDVLLKLCAGQRLLEKALERPRRGNIHVSHCGVFFSFALTADQPLVRAWKMKKVFFSFLLSSLPAAPSRMKKLAQKTRFFTFFFHCSALTAVPRGMKKKKVLNTSVRPMEGRWNV